jgi:sarcosine oxidase subunit gamma
LWLGPDEWLLLTPPGREVGLVEELRRSLGETTSSVNDVSGGQTVIGVGGDRARDVLAKGCTLDMHPRVFGPGRCAQTLVAKAAVVVRQIDESPSFDLIVRRSFADYLARWLEDAGQEYHLAVVG